MSRSRFLYVILYVLCAALGYARAKPVVARELFFPPVKNPTFGTTWYVGEQVTVAWDLSVLPPGTNLSRPYQIILGWVNTTSENLDIDHPLAVGASWTPPNVSFVVPNVTSRTSYVVCFFGDSSDLSQPFTILDSPPPSNSSSAPSSKSSNTPPSDPGSSPSPSTPTLTPPPTSSSNSVGNSNAAVSRENYDWISLWLSSGALLMTIVSFC